MSGGFEESAWPLACRLGEAFVVLRSRLALLILAIVTLGIAAVAFGASRDIRAAGPDSPYRVFVPGLAGDSAGKPTAQPTAPPMATPTTQPPGADGLPHLGSMTFATDDSVAAVHVTFHPGTQSVLQLIDRAGLTWALTIPADALSGHRTITMRALKDIQSGNLPGKLVGGILLTPEGLQFEAAATLSVTGPVGTVGPVLLTGASDGSAMDTIGTVPLAVPVSLQIWHFSPYVLDDPATQGNLASFIAQLNWENNYNVKAARALLKQTDIPVGVPPSIELQCTEDITSVLDPIQVDTFIRQTLDPEFDLVNRLLDNQRTYLTLGDDSHSAEINGLISQLVQRLDKKVNTLLRNYKGQPDKIIPVANTALGIALAMQRLGQPDSMSLPEIGQWVASNIDGLLKDLTEKHDYQQVQPIIQVAKMAELLGADAARYLQKISPALTFKLETGLALHVQGPTTWQLDAQFTMTPNEALRLTGSGTGNYTSFNGPIVPDGPILPMQPASFPVKARVDEFDPCAGTARISVDRYYADTETYGRNGEVTIPLVHGLWARLFKSYEADGWYTFTVTLNNLQAAAVNDSVDAADGDDSGTFAIKLTHTPGK